jgi:hypothetical protein
MSSLYPDPGFEYYCKACKKGDPEAKAVTVDQSPVATLAHASEITGLPRDNFEVQHGKLWLEQGPFGAVPPARHLADATVA